RDLHPFPTRRSSDLVEVGMKSSETTLPDQIDWVETDDRSLLASRLARQVADWLRTALQEQERASLAVSGGKTPLNFFSALSQLRSEEHTSELQSREN